MCGSSEVILYTSALLTLFYALEHQHNTATMMLGPHAHWQIYLIIYGVSCVSVITLQHSGISCNYIIWLEDRHFVSPCLVEGHIIILGAIHYAMWGYPFLYKAYLYHTDRHDHQHNFSPYFYLIYLTYSSSRGISTDLLIWHQLLHSLITSLIP
ncbi:mannosyltransferase [Suillus subaureus]|uniref:GPI mannosyltransferase 1 n=1 Tax=Suillus subaureus TaxID=48587 RepID=A0A9P7JF46_9AGAM|nr:mannosyltransferase [Suillus subaureus]KAG1818599.1 mannosyltransferase [Suillus subaureus]